MGDYKIFYVVSIPQDARMLMKLKEDVSNLAPFRNDSNIYANVFEFCLLLISGDIRSSSVLILVFLRIKSYININHIFKKFLNKNFKVWRWILIA